MEIAFSSNFLRKAKKLSKKDKILLSERTDIFRNNSNNPRLKTHPLTGKLKGMLSFSLNYSKRVIFLYVEPNKVLFFDIGSHNEVYRQ
jgi:mRNA-degrading endonuclease YafQ of YafQ-DinJ toxin-antitoxin module